MTTGSLSLLNRLLFSFILFPYILSSRDFLFPLGHVAVILNWTSKVPNESGIVFNRLTNSQQGREQNPCLNENIRVPERNRPLRNGQQKNVSSATFIS